MTNDRELLQQALDALEGYARNCRCEGGGAPCDAAKAIRARLAQPEREWQGLTLGELLEIDHVNQHILDVAKAIEAKLKEKNS